MSDIAARETAGAHRPPFTGRRAECRYVQTILAPPERVFPLLCPVREAEWADGWVCRPIYAPSGLAEEDGVYAVPDEGAASPMIWLITKRDTETREIELVYFQPERQVVRIDIAVEAGAAPDTSRVLITYVRTGITEEGNAVVARAAHGPTFAAAMQEWERAMNHYLATGECLRTPAPSGD